MNEHDKPSFWRRCLGGVSPRDRRNQRLILWSNLAWALSFVGASMTLSRGWVTGPAAWALAAVPVVLSVVVMVVYSRFLRQTDELQRLIQLEALALGFGGSLFGLLAYVLLRRLGVPEVDLADLSVGMIGLYVLGIFIGWRRYQ